MCKIRLAFTHPISPWIPEMSCWEDDLLRLGSIHSDRLDGELRELGGNAAMIREYLSHHPERRCRFLRSIRGTGGWPGCNGVAYWKAG